MQNPVTSSPTSTNWLDQTPGADTPFDELFGGNPDQSLTNSNPETQTTTTSAASSQTVDGSQVRPPETFGTEWEPIKTRTGSVYNSREDTTKGIEEKDALIEQLRAKYKAATGQDPIAESRRPSPQAQAQTGYLNNPTKYAEDLAAAAKSGDANRYMQVQLALQDEYNAPYRPILQDLARTAARTRVQTQVKDFDTFVNSEDFNRTLESTPALRMAIQNAEQDLRYSGQLEELYRLAYDSYTSRTRLPELVRAAQQTGSTPAAAPTLNRPVVQNSTLSPAVPTTQASDSELMRSPNGRAELIKRYQSQGMDNVRF